MARLISVNVGLPRDVSWHGQTVHTGIWKQPVQGLLTVRKLNVDGDGQGDLAGHGGEQRAVMVYQMDSYRYWERFLGRSDFELGQFGENFTVEDGLADDEVCIGDRYRIGSALFEVTQPRVTCYRVGFRMNDPQMPALLVSHRRPGFYFRVLQEGSVTAGDEISKVADGPERLTVAETDALLYLPARTPEALERALRIPALSAGWKGSFRALLNEQATGHATGNAGLTSLAAVAPPAWSGFRPLRVAAIQRESASVVSFWLESRERICSAAAPPGPVSGSALAHIPGCTTRPSQLLHFQRARFVLLPHQREAGRKRSRKQVSAYRSACWRHSRHCSAARRVYITARRRPRGPDERRHWGHPRLGNAACFGGIAI